MGMLFSPLRKPVSIPETQVREKVEAFTPNYLQKPKKTPKKYHCAHETLKKNVNFIKYLIKNLVIPKKVAIFAVEIINQSAWRDSPV